MKLLEKKKGETNKDYARRCHWIGCKHSLIARELGITENEVHDLIFKED